MVRGKGGAMKSLPDQLACARRELAMRQNVYPKWVKDSRMTQDKSNSEIDGMQSIIQTLEKLQMLAEVSEEMKNRK